MNLQVWAARLGHDVTFLGTRLVAAVGAVLLLAIAGVGALGVAMASGAAVIVAAPGVGVLVLTLVVALSLRTVSGRVRRWLSGHPFRRVVHGILGPVGSGLTAVGVWWLLNGRAAARRERVRIASYRGVDIPIAYRPLPEGRSATLRVMTADPATWRDLAHLVVVPVATVVAWAVLAGILIAAVALFASAPTFGVAEGPWWVDPATWAAVAAAVGLLAVTPVAVHGLGRGTAALGAALLATGESARMRAELDEQRLRRQLAVDAAERERRRIERDLHDGAQQRLVALGMSLGLARETLPTDPVAGAALVAEAHTEAKLALAELRDLARGIHPAILADRGLDAALSELLRRTRVPVSIFVALPQRLPTVVESAAYFVVSEALTNVSHHARACRATVDVRTAGGHILVEVTDDGVGGADTAAGTGLLGLIDRVGALGGRLTVTSPPGGPTTVRAEVPCES